MYGAVRTKYPQWKTLLEKLRLKIKLSVLIILFEHKLSNDAVFDLLRLKLLNTTQSMCTLLYVRLYSLIQPTVFMHYSSCRVHCLLQFIIRHLIQTRFLLLSSADVFQPQVRYWLKCSAWCEERGLLFRGIRVGGEAVLIALKVTRLRRPTLTPYPYCRQQTTCWPEELRGLISVIMNGLRPMNRPSYAAWK